MASGENVLWVVDRVRASDLKILKSYVFRTRDAAKVYAYDRQAKQKVSAYLYDVKRATWGPEQ